MMLLDRLGALLVSVLYPNGIAELRERSEGREL
jgi:hypothetical protein